VGGSRPAPDQESARGARLWRAADLGGVELFSATIGEFAFRPHAHEEFFIALTERGLATPTYRGNTHAIGPGDLIVLNPEEAHSGGSPAEHVWTYRALYPRQELMREIMPEFHSARIGIPQFGGDVVRDQEIAARLHRFHALSEAPESSALERETHLAEALVLLVGRHATPTQTPRPPGREHNAVRLAREYLEGHPEENVTLQTLARIAGLSSFHFCRVFRDTVGMTPHVYHTHIRVRHAKSLLRTGRPITQVATEVGFYDQAHLTRHFKHIVGVTPGRYITDPTT